VSASEILEPLINALDLAKVRLHPPQRFIFFCGGKLSDLPDRPTSLRGYLRRRIERLKDTKFIYAESATALFRDSGYSDLIQFEADIAQISEIVLLIAESAGSLTELGAFAMHARIAPRLQVFIRNDYYNAESFIRHGPIRLLGAAVSYYPWRTYQDDRLKISSIKSHIRDIKRDITTRLESLKRSEVFSAADLRHVMIIMFWCIYELRGATAQELCECLGLFGINQDTDQVKKYLYCMRVAGWVGETQYQHTVWYYARFEIDPLKYAYRPGTAQKDSLRWRTDVGEALKNSDAKRPKPIIEAMGT
jgi:hypothetical protein